MSAAADVCCFLPYVKHWLYILIFSLYQDVAMRFWNILQNMKLLKILGSAGFELGKSEILYMQCLPRNWGGGSYKNGKQFSE